MNSNIVWVAQLMLRLQGLCLNARHLTSLAQASRLHARVRLFVQWAVDHLLRQKLIRCVCATDPAAPKLIEWLVCLR
jgi:hypothetical protein